MNANSTKPVGLANYVFAFTNPAMISSFKNNLVWLLLYPTITLVIALLIAVLSDRVWYENLVKAVVFIPMAISFVAAGVIWKLMYDYSPAGSNQTGTVNALLMALNSWFCSKGMADLITRSIISP